MADPVKLGAAIGFFEIELGLLVLLWPVTPIAAFVCAWKIATELL